MICCLPGGWRPWQAERPEGEGRRIRVTATWNPAWFPGSRRVLLERNESWAFLKKGNKPGDPAWKKAISWAESKLCRGCFPAPPLFPRFYHSLDLAGFYIPKIEYYGKSRRMRRRDGPKLSRVRIKPKVSNVFSGDWNFPGRKRQYVRAFLGYRV